jgi:hypothetical protein
VTRWAEAAGPKDVAFAANPLPSVNALVNGAFQTGTFDGVLPIAPTANAEEVTCWDSRTRIVIGGCVSFSRLQNKNNAARLDALAFIL